MNWLKKIALPVLIVSGLSLGFLLQPPSVSAAISCSVVANTIGDNPIAGEKELTLTGQITLDPFPTTNTQYIAYLTTSPTYQDFPEAYQTQLASFVFYSDSCAPGALGLCDNMRFSIPQSPIFGKGGFPAIIEHGNQPIYLRLVEMPAAGNPAICESQVNISSYIPEMQSILGVTEEEPPVEPPVVGNPMDGVTAETFDALNPLKQVSEGVEEDLSSPGGILTRVLRFAFPIAGFILFIMLIWAGFEIVSGATTGQKSLDAGKQRATAAIIGFILLFISYFIAQLLQVVFGIKIL